MLSNVEMKAKFIAKIFGLSDAHEITLGPFLKIIVFNYGLGISHRNYIIFSTE